jgi:hypothetical protein
LADFFGVIGRKIGQSNLLNFSWGFARVSAFGRRFAIRVLFRFAVVNSGLGGEFPKADFVFLDDLYGSLERACPFGAAAPSFLAAALLAYFSNLSSWLTHYGTTPRPIYFGADYVTQQKCWQLGLIISVSNILIWASVGLVWWKTLGR